MATGQTDRETDGLTAASLNALTLNAGAQLGESEERLRQDWRKETGT